MTQHQRQYSEGFSGDVAENVERCLSAESLAILPPMDVKESLGWVAKNGIHPRVLILDPWYNKGVGGTRSDYREYILELLALSAPVAEHVFLWGFPEIVAYFVDKLPAPLTLVAWLTWYYKNNPSVIRGWRSSQNACLHLSRPNAALYPEHFLNDAQQELRRKGKLRYMPGPTSVIEEPLPQQLHLFEAPNESPADVIEAPLLVGFVGKKEQTGHPSQKPVSVIEKLILMTSKEGDLIFDPMCGSGTTGVAARKNGRLSLLCDHSEEYTQITEGRLGVTRVSAGR
ncbi:MAG: site-specific DNA-methyltransferase [Anaerolineae bacterium]|nr:site-specific DNA-methyltransferase [Anaerolineae bacterium]